MNKKEKILIIRLGALGDLILCFGAFAAIRQAHPDAEIALLTTAPFAAFANAMPWFDQVLVDERAAFSNLAGWWRLRRTVAAFAPTRVYDLQGKLRQSLLYFLLGGGLMRQWSGAAPLCSHPRLWPPVAGMHFTDFIAAQLQRAGVSIVPEIETRWLTAPLEKFMLPPRYALIIPGCAPNRLYKRWPPEYYAALAQHLAQQGIALVAIGTKAEAEAIAAIRVIAPSVIDLSSQTSLAEVAALARGAVMAVGNDTGPTHLAAAVGAPTLTLISDQVNPVWSAPKGAQAEWLQGKPLQDLSATQVINKVQTMMGKDEQF